MYYPAAAAQEPDSGKYILQIRTAAGDLMLPPESDDSLEDFINRAEDVLTSFMYDKIEAQKVIPAAAANKDDSDFVIRLNPPLALLLMFNTAFGRIGYLKTRVS